MSTLALNSTLSTTHVISIGSSYSYCFYQQLSFTPKQSLSQPKHIIPAIPRPRKKLPHNSSLSPIRKQRTPEKTPATEELNKSQIPVHLKRPFPLLTTLSSPAKLPTRLTGRLKVRFDEKVVVVCTIFDEEEEEDDASTNGLGIRRHSTGETNVESTLIYSNKPSEYPISLKLTKSLRQFKNRLLFIS
ncbi:hypothetical protein BDB01DRAFT_779046 [Pilobolus umbonatus]|nr:hypothetical protein BDB01DRAFT_779046 [Pilobolus umbonatus]